MEGDERAGRGMSDRYVGVCVCVRAPSYISMFRVAYFTAL